MKLFLALPSKLKRHNIKVQNKTNQNNSVEKRQKNIYLAMEKKYDRNKMKKKRQLGEAKVSDFIELNWDFDGMLDFEQNEKSLRHKSEKFELKTTNKTSWKVKFIDGPMQEYAM